VVVAVTENFLARWARRKAAARGEEADAERMVYDAASRRSDAIEAPLASPPVDPASLPPLDSLGPESDVTAFLRPGVPAELRTAALRRMWTSDPLIAGFRGLNDYDEDYNAPHFLLTALDKIADVGERLMAPASEPPAAASEPVAAASPETPIAPVAPEAVDDASPLRRVRRGGATPV
jgi:hypothetical protein